VKIPPVGNWKEKSDTMFLSSADSLASSSILAIEMIGYRMERGIGVESRSERLKTVDGEKW
jgi:hypothetical protein